MLKNQYKEFFKTLGNQQRVEIILFLLEGNRNVSEIADHLKAEQSTVSHNLKRLLKCSFISVQPNGKERVYTVNEKTIGPLFKLIRNHSETYCKKLCC
jgi:DNA-binding transcriptional ArsR family regulator